LSVDFSDRTAPFQILFDNTAEDLYLASEALDLFEDFGPLVPKGLGVRVA